MEQTAERRGGISLLKIFKKRLNKHQTGMVSEQYILHSRRGLDQMTLEVPSKPTIHMELRVIQAQKEAPHAKELQI